MEWESMQSIIFNLKHENIVESANLIMDNFDNVYPITFNKIISGVTLKCFTIKIYDFDICLDFIKEIEKIEENINSKSKIYDIFVDFLLHHYKGSGLYLLNSMIEQHFIEPKVIQNEMKPYFVHYMANERINIIKNDSQIPYSNYLSTNYEELSKNDWELHKKYVKEGHNPSEIAQIIRSDKIEKLQEISSQNNFNFNQAIERSLYERCSFVNQENVSLIDYAAFSSVKCFKYLIMNGANVKNTGKYAVAGGNEEIIHLCEQNHSSFEDAYETAIGFHRNDIFHYLYENKICHIKKLEDLGKKCISSYNYEIFSYLIKEGMKINNGIINESARIGNIYLTKYFFKDKQIPKNILVFSIGSRNIEFIDFILKQKGIDINATGINLNKTKSENYIWRLFILLNSALMYASWNDDTEIIKLLLDQEGININFKGIHLHDSKFIFIIKNLKITFGNC